MPDVVLYIATSLDGFIATPDGGIDWLSQIETPEEDYGYATFYADIDALVMGRHTYNQVLTFGDWPYPDRPTYVMTQWPLSPSPPQVTATAQSPTDLVATCQQQGYQRLWLVGGAALAKAFRAEGLISEYILTVIPVLLGDGLPLFAAPGPMTSVQLRTAQSFASGVVQLTYQAAKPA